MSLSNTATPKYYGQFREAVMRGEIKINKEIAMQMARIDERIENPNFYYNDKAIDGYVAFCENELTLTDGSPLKLLPTFKLWAEDALSWFYFVERSVPVVDPNTKVTHYVTKRVRRRLTNKQYLIVGRGAAKSMYASTMHAYILVVDGATTYQVTTAPTMDLAEEVMSSFRTAITRARGPLFSLLTQGSIQNTTGSRALRPKLCSTKKGIENFLTNSLLQIRPMSIDKLQGLRTKLATVDEWLSGDIREDVIGAIEQGASKSANGMETDYLIIATSSEGTVRNGAGDNIKMELMKILRGEYVADNVSIWYYKLDDISEVADPSCWIKAQPNIGRTVEYEVYQRDVERMEAIPSSRNDILAKRFGIPMEGYTYFFNYEETLPGKKRSFWGCPCAIGADMSQGDDFCAFAFLFPLQNGTFGVKCRAYISSKTLNSLTASLRERYNDFLREGSLIVFEGNTIDMDLVYDDFDRHIQDCDYDPRCFGYDPYNARTFVEKWNRDYGDNFTEKVIQGARTESVPLGDIKHLCEERALLFDEELMSFCMGNCITLEDTNGNRKLLKKRREEKIDTVSALMDAYVAYKLHLDEF